MMVMNCKELEHEWCERLGSPTTSAAEWSPAARQHFAVCDSCRRLREAEVVLERAIDVWQRRPQPEWTPDFSGFAGECVSFTRAVPVAEVRRPRSPSDGAGVLAALLATCGVAVLALIGLSTNGSRTATIPNGAPLSAQAVATTSDLEVTAFMSDLWQGMRHGSANAAQLTVTSLSFPPSPDHVAEQTPAEATDDLAATEEAALPWLELGRPVSKQIGAAFRFLGDVLPTPEDSAS